MSSLPAYDHVAVAATADTTSTHAAAATCPRLRAAQSPARHLLLRFLGHSVAVRHFGNSLLRIHFSDCCWCWISQWTFPPSRHGQEHDHNSRGQEHDHNSLTLGRNRRDSLGYAGRFDIMARIGCLSEGIASRSTMPKPSPFCQPGKSSATTAVDQCGRHSTN